MKKAVMFIFVASLFIISCKDDKGPLPVIKKVNPCDSTIHYSTTIVPILTSNCTSKSCHNSGSVNGDYTTYAGIKAKVDNGSLYNRVVSLKTMPAAGPLPDSLISEINCWIQQAAPNN